MATRDASGRLTAEGMAEVIAAGGSVFWDGANVTSAAGLPTQAEIDTANETADLPSSEATGVNILEQLEIIADKL